MGYRQASPSAGLSSDHGSSLGPLSMRKQRTLGNTAQEAQPEEGKPGQRASTRRQRRLSPDGTRAHIRLSNRDLQSSSMDPCRDQPATTVFQTLRSSWENKNRAYSPGVTKEVNAPGSSVGRPTPVILGTQSLRLQVSEFETA